MSDLISRQAAIDALVGITMFKTKHELMQRVNASVQDEQGWLGAVAECLDEIEDLPSVQPERKWIPCSNPPKHHRDVIVRGTELIGYVTVHKVMQWDVDTWRPTDYAPSIIWKEWSEI